MREATRDMNRPKALRARRCSFALEGTFGRRSGTATAVHPRRLCRDAREHELLDHPGGSAGRLLLEQPGVEAIRTRAKALVCGLAADAEGLPHDRP